MSFVALQLHPHPRDCGIHIAQVMSHKGGAGGNASYGTDPSDASHRDWSGCLDTHFMELVKSCTLNSEDLVYGDPATAQKNRGNLHTAFAIN